MNASLSLDGLVGVASRVALATQQAFAQPRLSILIFHRVLPVPDPLFPGEMHAALFHRRMAFIAKSFRVLALESAIEHLRAGTLPHRALAITFDDGYADNAEVAMPILRHHGLTATFFIASGFLDGGIMWNDAVIDAVRRSRKSQLDLRFLDLGIRSLTSAAARREVIDAALLKIKYLSLEARELAIRQLQDEAGTGAARADGLMMQSEQVRSLHAACMSIGAHTVNHPILATMDLGSARDEISRGRSALESIIESPIATFAYPNGRPGRDYVPEQVSLVRKLGFLGAVTTATGVAKAGCDLFQLPRCTPWGRTSLHWAARMLANQRNSRFESV